MKFQAFVSALMVGVATPLAMNLSVTSADAQPLPSIPAIQVAKALPLTGTFSDKDWMVTVIQQDGRYHYYGHTLTTGMA